MPKVNFNAPAQRELHLNKVLSGSKATYAAWAVLEAMCRHSDFKSNTVKITSIQLEKSARRCNRTIKEAMRFLKREGTIVPIANAAGGRGVAVTYALISKSNGDDVAKPKTLKQLTLEIMKRDKCSYEGARRQAASELADIDA